MITVSPSLVMSFTARILTVGGEFDSRCLFHIRYLLRRGRRFWRRYLFCCCFGKPSFGQ
jgi:hypothetical protein